MAVQIHATRCVLLIAIVLITIFGLVAYHRPQSFSTSHAHVLSPFWNIASPAPPSANGEKQQQQPVITHIVLFEFRSNASQAQINNVKTRSVKIWGLSHTDRSTLDQQPDG